MIYGSKVRMPRNGASFLGIVLVMAGVACGDASNNPNGISTGGTSAGRGGGASTAGRSGSGGSAPGGSAGAGGDSSDAGLAGTSGSSDASSPTGGGGRPPGCPEPNPVAVTGQTVVIQSLNVNTSEMILRNATSTPQSIVLGRANWQWCNYPRYWSLSDEETTVELAPGETYSFIPVNNQSEVPELDREEGEMAIYSRAQDFNDFETLESFVAWGDVQAFRESYAVQKGVWTFGERIEIAPGDAGFIATGDTDFASGYTSAPARCLVP
jgi:hypothetical protein